MDVAIRVGADNKHKGEGKQPMQISLMDIFGLTGGGVFGNIQPGPQTGAASLLQGNMGFSDTIYNILRQHVNTEGEGGQGEGLLGLTSFPSEELQDLAGSLGALQTELPQILQQALPKDLDALPEQGLPLLDGGELSVTVPGLEEALAGLQQLQGLPVGGQGQDNLQQNLTPQTPLQPENNAQPQFAPLLPPLPDGEVLAEYTASGDLDIEAALRAQTAEILKEIRQGLQQLAAANAPAAEDAATETTKQPLVRIEVKQRTVTTLVQTGADISQQNAANDVKATLQPVPEDALTPGAQQQAAANVATNVATALNANAQGQEKPVTPLQPNALNGQTPLPTPEILPANGQQAGQHSGQGTGDQASQSRQDSVLSQLAQNTASQIQSGEDFLLQLQGQSVKPNVTPVDLSVSARDVQVIDTQPAQQQAAAQDTGRVQIDGMYKLEQADQTHHQRQQQQIAEQVAVQMQKSVAAGKDRFTIKLEPPELGRVDIRMDIGSDNRIHLTVVASNADALEALQNNARRLEAALAQSGFDADAEQFQFSHRGEKHGNQQGGQSETGGQPEFLPEDDAELSAEMEPGTVTHYNIRPVTGVDIKV